MNEKFKMENIEDIEFISSSEYKCKKCYLCQKGICVAREYVNINNKLHERFPGGCGGGYFILKDSKPRKKRISDII